MTLDDLDLFDPETRVPLVQRAKCRRHRWITGGSLDDLVGTCARCGKVRDDAAARRGRNNGKRGRSDELKVARLLGGRKVGPLGLPWDVEVDGYMRLQVKKLATWPSLASVIKWMDAIPVGQEMRGVAICDRPAAGHRSRRLLILDLDEFSLHHGSEENRP